jgi:hypothetical protein
VFSPGLADLFEAIIIVRPATDPIEVLRDEWVIGIRQLKPVERLVAVVT